MTDRWCVPGALVVVLAWCGSAAAQERDHAMVLTLEEALARARRSAPEVLAARARVAIARGGVVAASPWQPYAPELGAAAGPRIEGDATRLDLDVSVGQRFELGGRRSARIAAAEARVAAAEAEAEDAARRLLAEVAATFHRGLYAEQRLAVLQQSAELAVHLRDVAERRHEAGDVGVLDVHVARLSAARAEAQVGAAEASVAAVLGELRALCAIPPTTAVRLAGDLGGERRFELDRLLASLRARPDLRALEAEERAAAADVELGEGLAWPDLLLFARYGREEGAHIVMGGVGITLPLFERGQGLRAIGRARGEAAQVEREGRAAALETRLSADVNAWRRALGAARRFEEGALRSLDETLGAARRAYEAGQVGLAELLSMQREMVEARLVEAELWLEVALLGTAIEARAGVMR